MKRPKVKRQRAKKREPLVILQPGERSPFWERVLSHRDANDPRWRLYSPGMKYAAEAYERNRDLEQRAAA